MPEVLMLTTGDALLRAVCETPEDVTPRMVLADWLEENGQAERGEFIRLQCRIADIAAEMSSEEDCGSPNCEGCKERRVLRRCERELLAQHQGRWTLDMLNSLPDRDRSELLQPTARDATRVGGWPSDESMFVFRRGFIEDVTLPMAVWRKHGAALVLASPVRSVRVSDREPFPLSGDGPEFPTRYSWWRDVGFLPQEDDTSDLPGDLFDVLEGGEPKPRHHDPIHRDYSTPDDAHKALSAACVAWARKEAGLPL